MLAAFDYGEFEEHAWLIGSTKFIAKSLSALAKESVMSRLRCWQEDSEAFRQGINEDQSLERTSAIELLGLGLITAPIADTRSATEHLARL